MLGKPCVEISRLIRLLLSIIIFVEGISDISIMFILMHRNPRQQPTGTTFRRRTRVARKCRIEESYVFTGFDDLWMNCDWAPLSEGNVLVILLQDPSRPV